MTKEILQKRKRHSAVALEYPEGGAIPVVTASGVGAVADIIVEIAKEHNVPLHEDEALTKLISQTKVGEYLDPQTSRIVAEVVCFLYSLDEEWQSKKKAS